MTSEESGPFARNGYRDLLHGLLADIIGAVRATCRQYRVSCRRVKDAATLELLHYVAGKPRDR
jgi:hypothetical protein